MAGTRNGSRTPPQAPVPPSNPDAEEHVIGALLIAKHAIEGAQEAGLRPDHFYRPTHGLLYAAAVELDAQGQPVDAITLSSFLSERGQLEEVGGKSRVNELAAMFPAAGNVGHYSRIIIETAALRGLTRAGTRITAMGYDPAGPLEEKVDEAQRLVHDLASESARGEVEPLDALLRERFAYLTELFQTGASITGTETGFLELDAILSGLQPSNLIVLAARPSMGKSALMMNVVEGVARPGVPVLVFSTEMSKGELTQRMMVSRARVDGQQARTGNLDATGWAKLSTACNELARLPIHVDETSAITLGELRAKARRHKARYPNLGLIAVDYLQIMGKPPGENENAQLAVLTGGLKALAKDLGVPVLLLSQLSRDVEKRGDKRPQLSDLRGSGSIEQDADVVLFLYRDDYYNPRSDDAGRAEVIVAKQRMGPTGDVKLRYISRYATFTNLQE